MVDEPRVPPLVQRHLDQVDAPRSSAGEGFGRTPQARERIGPQAHARPEALARAAGLDLDHDQRLAFREDEVELRPAGVQPPRQEAPAARPQRALDQSFSCARELRIPRREHAQREARPEARQERAPEPDQTLVGSALSSSTGSMAASITLWIAARVKRRRTLSATCSTTTSAVVVTTVP